MNTLELINSKDNIQLREAYVAGWAAAVITECDHAQSKQLHIKSVDYLDPIGQYAIRFAWIFMEIDNYEKEEFQGEVVINNGSPVFDESEFYVSFNELGRDEAGKLFDFVNRHLNNDFIN